MLSILAKSARTQGPENAAQAPQPAPPAQIAAGAPALPEPEIQLPKVVVRRETPKVGRNLAAPPPTG